MKNKIFIYMVPFLTLCACASIEPNNKAYTDDEARELLEDVSEITNNAMKIVYNVNYNFYTGR